MTRGCATLSWLCSKGPTNNLGKETSHVLLGAGWLLVTGYWLLVWCRAQSLSEFHGV